MARKSKIGTEVAHFTRDSDTTFRVKRSKVNLQGRGILWRPPAQLVTSAKAIMVTIHIFPFVHLCACVPFHFDGEPDLEF